MAPDPSHVPPSGSPKRVPSSKEGSFGQNVSLSAVAWIVPTVAAFLCLPIYVRGLGPEAYGLLVVVSAMTGYAGLIDIGLYQTLVRYLSYYRALDEGRPMWAIIRMALVWFAIAGAAISLFFVVGASWLAKDVLGLPAELVPNAVIVIRLSALNLVLGLFVSVGVSVPISFLRYDIAASLTGVFDTAGWVGPAVVVLLGHGIVGVTCFYTGSSVAALLAYLYFGRRLMRTVQRDAGPHWHEIRRKVFSFSGLVAADRIGATLAAQTNRLVLGIVGGSAAAAYYQVPSTMTMQVRGGLARVAQVVFPTGTALIARGDAEGLRAMYYRSSRLLFLVSCSAFVSIAVYAYPLLQYWVSPAYAEEGSVALVIFAIAQALSAASLAVGFLSWSAAKAGVNLTFALINTGISLLTIYPLASRFGVTGAAVATLLGACVAPFFIHYINRHVVEVSSRSVFRQCHLPTVAGAGLAALVSGVFLIRFAVSLSSTIMLVVATMLLSLAVSGLFGAVKQDEAVAGFRMTRSLFNRLLRR